MYFIGYLLILAIDRVAARAYHLSHGHEKKENNAINVNMANSTGPNGPGGQTTPNKDTER